MLADGAVAVAYAVFAVQSVVLAIIDLRTHRLPNRIVLPGYPVAIVLFGIAALLRPDPWALGRALLAGAILFAFYLLLRMLQRGGMGGGDVKLAGVIGIMLGFAGWDAVVIGLFAGFLGGGLYSAVLLARRRANRRTAVPFGPWMLLGAWVGIAAHLAGV
ncbi:A24 family peptidase [Microbacterium sp. cx-59]|uniref:prepilin peptidase n=1 Tax=Microbacterium sp. cx-59 TaxID=2891207 RepID=UPI001E64C956|nr:A24 family peptidase [Microbacterium sp. cx-59]MCC4907643.1 A24 family peptidase [Microbacterium sp. cx-59]